MAEVKKDEELGRSGSFYLSINTEDSSSSEDEYVEPGDGFTSLCKSSEPSFNTQCSENEDHVPELASLIDKNGGFASYGSGIANEPRDFIHKRTLSDESIATVAALPGMVLRAHSVINGKRGNCVIRHSLPKIGELCNNLSQLCKCNIC